MKTAWHIGGLAYYVDGSDNGACIPNWIEESSNKFCGSFVQPIPDFAAHSPLGSGEWFVPWDMRWNVSRPFSE